MGRGRLTREAKLRQERPCRGLLLSTGETTIEGEASILSRMLVIEVSPWEQRDPGGVKLAQADALRRHLSAFTATFAGWLAAKADTGTLNNDMASRFEGNAAGYRAKLAQQRGKHANTGRMVGNWAVLVSVYQLLYEFLCERDAEEGCPPWQDVIVETLRAVQQERAGRMFLNVVEQLLASGQGVILSLPMSEEAKPGVTIIGYQDAHYLYLLPEIAYREATRVTPLKFSAAAIGSQLKEEGLLMAGSSENHLSIQLRVQGHRVRVWRFRAELLSGDTGDSGDGLDER